MRRAVILPVVLFVLLLLGLFGAMFSFRIHADVSQVQAISNRLQTRLASEAGIEAAKMLLRTARFDRTQWYHNPDIFHRVLIWAHDTDSRTSGTTEELDETMAYRFSIVADDPTDDERYMRFGITDESSKININAATPEQLLALVEQVVLADADGDEEIDPKAIVDAIIDWRDADNTPSGEAGDTEGEYYLSLDKPYGVKNGEFSSVEELLLVKGVTGAILYGEDFDRNGLLTPNEDDGEASFPPDNEDGELNRGLFPYVSALSYENDTSDDNRPRVYLFSDEATLKKDLQQVFPDDPDAVKFIVAATRVGPGSGAGGKKPPGPGDKGDSSAPPGPGSGTGEAKPPSPGPTGTQPPPPLPKPGRKHTPSRKAQDAGPAGSTEKPPRTPAGPPRPRGAQPRRPREGQSPTEVLPPGAPPGQENENSQEGSAAEGEEKPEGAQGTADEAGGERSIRSPASLLRPRQQGGQDVQSPFSEEHLPLLLDRLTTRRVEDGRVKGLINVNTAPRAVLKCLPGLTEDQIDAIVAARDSLDAEALSTPAWLITEGVLELDAFDAIASSITARCQQFTIESLGYADHMGMITRLQVVVDMVGPIAQTMYYRDLSYLGASYPIREEDKEQVRGR